MRKLGHGNGWGGGPSLPRPHTLVLYWKGRQVRSTLHVALTPPPNVSYCWDVPPLLHLEHEQERRRDEPRSADHCEPDQLGWSG